MVAVYYGLSPYLVSTNLSDPSQPTPANIQEELDNYSAAAQALLEMRQEDPIGGPSWEFISYLNRTTRLLYVGQLVNELRYIGMSRIVHVYIEYFLNSEGRGYRVGALVCDQPLVHYRVDGPLSLV